MRILGLVLGLLIVLSASVELAVFGWHMATRAAAMGGTYLMVLVIPALVMLIVGVLVIKACWPTHGRGVGDSKTADR